MGRPASTHEPTVRVRALADTDAEAFRAFLEQVPAGDRRFLEQALTDRGAAFSVVMSDTKARRVVAVADDGTIIGLAGAFPGEGWSSHVAEVRVLVSADRRGGGVGRTLARAALAEALGLGCHHVYVEVVAEQEALVAMFQDLGFAPEALLADFVRDAHGDFHDLMLLTHRVADNRGRQHVMGLTEVTV